MASQPFDTISRAKMSWSEYSHFLIIGNMFSLLMDKLPFFASIYVTPLPADLFCRIIVRFFYPAVFLNDNPAAEKSQEKSGTQFYRVLIKHCVRVLLPRVQQDAQRFSPLPLKRPLFRNSGSQRPFVCSDHAENICCFLYDCFFCFQRFLLRIRMISRMMTAAAAAVSAITSGRTGLSSPV